MKLEKPLRHLPDVADVDHHESISKATETLSISFSILSFSAVKVRMSHKLVINA
jgi:hypothetical protein